MTTTLVICYRKRVTSEEAYQALGVDASATGKEARRAYMRLVKLHKPERDPEGFKRAREAYEVVKNDLESRAFSLQFKSAPEAAPSDNTLGVSAPSLSSAGEVSDPLDEFRKEAQSTETDAQAIAVWRRACAEHPTQAEAWQGLVDALWGADLDDEAGDALRVAYEAGHQQFAAQLLASGKKPPDKLLQEAWDSEELRPMALSGIVRSERVEDAAAWCSRLLSDENLQSDPTLGVGSLYTIIELLDLLVIHGRWAEAKALNERIASALAEGFGGPLGQDTSTVAHWTLTSELLQVAEQLPADIAKGLALVCAGQGEQRLTYALSALKTQNSARHKRVLKTLSTGAPALHPIANPTISDEDTGKIRFWSLKDGLGGIFILLVIVRVVITCTRLGDSHSADIKPDVPRVESSPEAPVPAAKSLSSKASAPPRLDEGVHGLNPGGNEGPARIINEVLSSLAAKDCKALQGQLSELDQMTREAPAVVRDQFRTVRSEINAMCPEHRPTMAPQ